MKTIGLMRPIRIQSADLTEQLIRLDIFVTRMVEREPEKFMPWLREVVDKLEEQIG